jgi:hypothetical protein
MENSKMNKELFLKIVGKMKVQIIKHDTKYGPIKICVTLFNLQFIIFLYAMNCLLLGNLLFLLFFMNLCMMSMLCIIHYL